MRQIPKSLKVKKTIWKCYSFKDLMIALLFFSPTLLLFVLDKPLWGCVLLFLGVLLLLPIGDGILYEDLFLELRFLVSPKHIEGSSVFGKTLLGKPWLLRVEEDGTIHFPNGLSAQVYEFSSKNFGLEDEVLQNGDIEAFSRILQNMQGGDSIDLIRCEMPVSFVPYTTYIFGLLQAYKNDSLRAPLLEEELNRLDSLEHKHKQYKGALFLVYYAKSKQDLYLGTSSVEEESLQMGLTAHSLNRSEVREFLRFCVKRDFDGAPEKKYHIKNRVLESEGLESCTYRIKGYPAKVRNAWGAGLFSIPGTKVVMHMEPVDVETAIKRIDRCLEDLDTKTVFSEKISTTQEAELHRDSMLELLEELQSENEVLIDVLTQVTAYGYHLEEDYRTRVKRTIKRYGFQVSNMAGRQLEGALFSFPREKTAPKREFQSIPSTTCAAVFPFVETTIMNKEGHLLGEDLTSRSPYIFNLWKRGPLYQNSNAMVIGKSGSGKSFFMKTLLSLEFARGTRIFVLDPEAEYRILAKNLGGETLDVGNAQDGRINPFHIYPVLGESGEETDSALAFKTHLKTLETFFKMTLQDCPQEVLELLFSSIQGMYYKKGITEATILATLNPEDYPVMQDLYTYMEEQAQTATYFKKDYMIALLHLSKFVSGRYADLWGGPSTITSKEDFLDLDFQSLFANKNGVVAGAQMLLFFRFLEQEVLNEQKKKGQKRHILIVCDEAHLFIDPKYPCALDFFHSMSKRIRKYGGAFIPATQNIADWNQNEELRGKTTAILKNSQYLFFFRLSSPDLQDVHDLLKGSEGLTQEEDHCVLSLRTGDCFFIGSQEERACVRIQAGPKQKQLFEGTIHETPISS